MDAEYRFGQPRVYLTPLELARLTILRSRLGDTDCEREAVAAGLPGGAVRPARRRTQRTPRRSGQILA